MRFSFKRISGKKKYLILFIFLIHIPVFAQVKTGIEVLRDLDFKPLEGKKVGLLTNPTGVDSGLKSTIDILFEAPNVNLVALFAPEHGVRGDEYAGASIHNSFDVKTGLPVYSLHGKTKKPTPEMLNDLDVIVYDIQDIGCRSYTFISTLGLLMEAAGENNKEVVVLDRPNPLGGYKTEGPLVEKEFISFVSQFPIPYIYGLTCGELANLLNKEKMTAVPCSLTVIPMNGWRREMKFEDTGLPWVLTSPHIPRAYTSYFYPLSGIVGELNAMSVGVGYTLPFEVFGAEWIHADSLVEKMNKLELPGIMFRPITYKPFYAFGNGKVLQGVQVYITDADAAQLSLVQFYIIQELYKMYPDKNLFRLGNLRNYRMFDNVCGTDKVRIQFTSRFRVEDIEKIWIKEVEGFRQLAKKYWIYE
jgi:uncharacterized protein YbbC (DUF1343 family)